MTICATACALPYADRSAHMSCASPPYYQMRRYEGVKPAEWPAVSYSPMAGLPPLEVPAVTPEVIAGTPDAGILGREPDIFAYIGHLVLIAREVWRVLRDDGVFCVNIGDSYCATSSGGTQGSSGGRQRRSFTATGAGGLVPAGLKQKDLMLIPSRLALALQVDGWFLRSRMPGGVENGSQIELQPNVIWTKNVMPESVRDRPSVDFEDLFIFSKSKRYCWDDMAARVPTAGTAHSRGNGDYLKPDPSNGIYKLQREPIPMRNLRASWRINTEPTSERHYASWPRELVRRLISIGTSDKGCCPECGAQWGRVTKRTRTLDGEPVERGSWAGEGDHPIAAQGVGHWRFGTKVEDLGWAASCACAPSAPIPCSVLDPFSGIGRTGEVCYELGRRYMSAEISIGYAAIQHRRLADHRTVARGEALRPLEPQTITGPLFP